MDILAYISIRLEKLAPIFHLIYCSKSFVCVDEGEWGGRRGNIRETFVFREG